MDAHLVERMSEWKEAAERSLKKRWYLWPILIVGDLLYERFLKSTNAFLDAQLDQIGIWERIASSPLTIAAIVAIVLITVLTAHAYFSTLKPRREEEPERQSAEQSPAKAEKDFIAIKILRAGVGERVNRQGISTLHIALEVRVRSSVEDVYLHSWKLSLRNLDGIAGTTSIAHGIVGAGFSDEPGSPMEVFRIDPRNRLDRDCILPLNVEVTGWLVFSVEPVNMNRAQFLKMIFGCTFKLSGWDSKKGVPHDGSVEPGQWLSEIKMNFEKDGMGVPALGRA